MHRLRPLMVAAFMALAIALGGVGHASAQIRLQETPALNGLGSFLFEDVSIQLDAGYGDDTLVRKSNKDVAKRTMAGIFVDKPFVSYFLDIFYDRDRYLGEPLERDTLTRDFLIEPLRFVAHYRVGDFSVVRGNTVREQSSDFYVGLRYKLELGRVFRHLPPFQK
jgi:hypothetical protein